MGQDRAIVFIDGNNWYHGLRDVGVSDLLRLDYAKISQKLVGPARQWIGTRYYIGRMRQDHSAQLYSDQRSFLSRLEKKDARITTHLGRLESRVVTNPMAGDLDDYLNELQARHIRLDKGVFHSLRDIAARHRRAPVLVEKAVDVMLAVDMVMMAQRGEYEAGYLLSADGDYTPVADAVRALGKKIYAASPLQGAQLAARVNSFIPLAPKWFIDCY